MEEGFRHPLHGSECLILDETTSPQSGVYVVYLFTTDMQTLTLSLNQDITRMANDIGFAAARRRLAKDAKAVRDALSPQLLGGLAETLNLNPAGEKFYLENQKAYAAANIAALEYASDALPDEAVLREDLHRLLELYQDAIAVKRQLLQADPGSIGSPSAMQTTAAQADPLVHFKPKDDEDYVAHIKGRTLVKTRRHETVVNQYSKWVRGQGFQPATPHPQDLVLLRDDQEWLIEAKVLYRGNATHAVRAAIGQFYAYKYFHYVDKTAPRLVALFSEPVGPAYVDFLESCDISVVWREESEWRGSYRAVQEGMPQPIASLSSA